MIHASIEFLGVEWVGDGPVLVRLGPLLGSLFIAVVAAYAARLAAKTANSRQHEQLIHDANRQREQLAHDTDRQKMELEHDRAMRKQAHARDALDAAIELVGEVQDEVIDAGSGAESLESQRPALHDAINAHGISDEERNARGKELFEKELEFRREMIAARSKVLEMYGASVRLRLRFGSTHSIPTKYIALMDAWGELLDALDPVEDHDREDHETEDANKANEAANDCYAALMVECEYWFK